MRRDFCCASLGYALVVPRILASDPSETTVDGLKVPCAAMLLIGCNLIKLDHFYDEYPTKINGGLVSWELKLDNRNDLLEPDRYGWYSCLKLNKDWGNRHWRGKKPPYMVRGTHQWAMAIDVKKDVFKGNPDEVVSLGQNIMRKYARGDLQQRVSEAQIESWTKVISGEME